MVARTDLRPTRADDSLKKLLGKVTNPQTTPHGVKVAQPGEYVSFHDTAGVAHRWDGDTIAEYDTRIAEGAAAVAEAQAHLAEVEAELAEAQERITASNGDLTLYIQRVEAAQAAADTANAALQNLTSELETAQSAVDAVTARTGAVESAIIEADTKATQAASDAATAQDAAQNALAASQQVQADAQNALSKAEEAETKALETAGIAAGKGKIIYSASEPSGTEESPANLWIRSSDSKPHRWDGTRWVEVTDKAIVDAASAAAAAQGTATKAVADAAAAQKAADTAKAAADTAQAAANAADSKAVTAKATADKAVADASTAQSAANAADAKALAAAGIADGKGRVIYSTRAPGTADRLSQNLWVRLPDNVPHRWSGSTWVAITDKTATDAASAAATAQAAANAAKATADKAVADAAKAQTAADNAQAAAQSADARAVAAQNAANAAQATADTAKANAATAQSTADTAKANAATAQSTADTANAKALEAAGIAGGKGKVIYASSAPTGTDANAQNLWIRSADNIPHRWSGSAWVAVTDKTATDAAAAAANAASAAQAAQTAANNAQAAANAAKATADKAVADAAAAASAAQAANIAAGNAQRTADGKTVALFGTATPPPAPGVTQGDLYYRTGADNRIIEHWQWSGSAWVKRAIESAQLVNFDAGYITSGFLDVSKRIQAGSIHADKVFVGVGDNLMPPLSMTANYGGELVGNNLSATGGYTGGVSIVLPAGTAGIGSYLSNTGQGGDYLIKVNPGSNLHVSVWVKPGNPSGRPTIYTRFINSATKAWSFGTPSIIYRDGLPAGEWYNLAGEITPPANFVYDRVRVGFYANGNHAEMVFSDPAVREMKDGSLIVNGSIAGEKVNAQSVAAAVGSFVKVNAENVTVTSELAARVVNAMTAQVKNLVVTESAILQHSTLLGETVAEQLNVTKKLVARDAIIDGTLDVAQLNVTEAMSAQIVSAMSLESKKLVVTEDAILNRATVVQSLVTPELIADKINVNNLGARLVTSGAIQTDPAANRGVKITNAGVNAWDSNGVQTIRLNGADNLLMGQLATGDSTAGCIRVFNAMHPVNQRPSGFITIQDAGGITASQGVIEYNNSTLQLSIKDGTEQGYSQPFRKGVMVTRDGLVLAGNLAVNGQFSKGGAIAAYAISAGTIPAGSYVSFSQPITLSNGQRPWPVIQPASSNFAKLDVAAWIPNNRIEGRIYNNSNFAATNVWIDILTFGIER